MSIKVIFFDIASKNITRPLEKLLIYSKTAR